MPAAWYDGKTTFNYLLQHPVYLANNKTAACCAESSVYGCFMYSAKTDSTTCLVNFIHPNKLSSSRSHCSFSIGVQKMIWLGFQLVAFQIWKNWKLARVKCISQVYNIACHFQQQFEVPNIGILS